MPAPTLNNIKPISNAQEDTDYVLNFGLLKAFADESKDTKAFKINGVDSTKGKLILGKTGQADVIIDTAYLNAHHIYVGRSGVTVDSTSGYTLKWKTPNNGNGNFSQAFTIQASGSENSDSSLLTGSVGVQMSAAPVNDAPTLTTLSTLTAQAVKTQPYEISYATLAAASDAADADGDAIFFRIQTVSNGELKIKNGTNWNSVSTGDSGGTLVGSGDVLQWTPNNTGTVTAFTVKAYDGIAASDTSIAVQANVIRNNTAPTLTGVTTTHTIDDTATVNPFSSVTFADAENDNVTVTIQLDSAAKGEFTAASLSGFSGSNGLYTLTNKTPAEATTAIKALVFNPTDNRVAVGQTEITTFRITVQDSLIATLKNTDNTTTVTSTSVNVAPTVSTNTIPLAGTEDTPLFFKRSDFTEHYSDADGDALSKIKITALPDAGKGILKLGTDNVSINAEIDLTQVGNLNFVPTANFNAATAFTGFQWAGSDGTVYSSAASMQLTVAAVNDAPTLTSISSLSDSSYLESQPAIISYTALAAAADEADIDSTHLAFRIEAVTTGILEKANGSNWATVTEGTTTLSSSEQLRWTPFAGQNGALNAFTVKAWDGFLASARPVQVQVNVIAVNDAPYGTDGRATLEEDDTHTFQASDFGYSDPEGDLMSAVRIDTLPLQGTLRDNGTAVIANQVITVADINKLTFTPAQDGYANDYAKFTFSVKDSGSPTALFDTTPNTFTFDVTAVNDAPVATIAPTTYSATEQVDLNLAVTSNGLSISDVDAGAFTVTATLTITGGSGILTANRGSNTGVTVTSNDSKDTLTFSGTVADINKVLSGINGATLTYQANSDTPPTSSTLTLSVDDSGNSGSGGNKTAHDTATINITAVNDAPFGTDKTLTLNEDTSHTFQASDFGFYDPEGDALASVRIESIPVQGTLKLNNVALTAATLIPAASIGQLTYTPAPDGNGLNYASFNFKVQDNGTGNLWAAGSNTLSFNVSPVNDAPTATISRNTYTATTTSPLTLSATGISIYDVDAGTHDVITRLAVTVGSLSVNPGTNSVTVTNNDTTGVTLRGSLSAINAVLTGTSGATVTYTTPSSGSAKTTTLTLSVTDNFGLKSQDDTASINFGNTSVLQGSNSPLSPTPYDAATGSKNYLIDFSGGRNPGYSLITGFGGDDSLNISGIAGSHLSIANRGTDVLITANLGGGQASRITLTNVATASQIINNIASFNALETGDISFVTETTSVVGGSIAAPTQYDAADMSTLFMADYTNGQNTGYAVIAGFGTDDSLTLYGLSEDQLTIANRGADVLITANLGGGQATQITLTGIASPSQIIYGLASFNALPDAGNITLI